MVLLVVCLRIISLMLYFAAIFNSNVTLFTMCKLLTPLNPLSAKYDGGNVMKYFFDAVHKAKYKPDIILGYAFAAKILNIHFYVSFLI